MQLVGKGDENHRTHSGVFDRVSNSGRNRETDRLATCHRDVAHAFALANTNESRPHNNEYFQGSFVIMIAPNGAWLRANHMHIALAGQQHLVHRLNHPTARIFDNFNRLDRDLGIHVVKTKANFTSRQPRRETAQATATSFGDVLERDIQNPILSPIAIVVVPPFG